MRREAVLVVSLISSPEELPAALSRSWEFDSTVCLIEKMIVGTEWTLAMIDDEPLTIDSTTNNTYVLRLRCKVSIVRNKIPF